jgi:HlyD family secretion protein
MGAQPRQKTASYPEGIMRSHSIRSKDRAHQSDGRTRGYTGRRSATGDSTAKDVGTPTRPRGEILTDKPSKSYDSIAVVVGRKSDPRSRRLRISTIHSGVGQAIHRTKISCFPFLKRAGDFVFNYAYGGVSNQTDDAGLKAYILRSFESERRAGRRVLAVALLVGGGWATLVPLSGAVVIPGTVIAESNIKKIQHPTGGVIASISVRDGMRVQEGDVLVRLDDTQVRANFQVVTTQLDEIKARLSRLTAERDGHDGQTMPLEVAFTRDENKGQLLTTENSLFKARADTRKSQRELLRNRIDQLNEEITGLDAQIKSKQTQLELIGQELEGVQALYDKRLTPLTRLTSLQREAARLDGERGQLVSSIAETRAKISESELQLVKLDQDFRADVVKDLREAQDKEAELAERVVAAQDQLNHIDLRAPTTGVVHQLSAHTIGGVVGPAEVIMVIVPESDELQIDARLPAYDIDQVHKGQSTLVRFSAFNQRTTPELSGIVSHVSADITRDEKSNTSYYTVRVGLPGDEVARLSGLQLISGMPAEVFVQTGSRTMMSYLFKPFNDQLHRMFRER